MKTWIIIFFVFTTMLSCSTLPPPKKFTTVPYVSFDLGCLYLRISETENKEVCPGDADYPTNPIVIDVGDLKKEIDYQNELINACKVWR
jgi:hypothetical protein